jgi:hypothetical protein
MHHSRFGHLIGLFHNNRISAYSVYNWVNLINNLFYLGSCFSDHRASEGGPGSRVIAYFVGATQSRQMIEGGHNSKGYVYRGVGLSLWANELRRDREQSPSAIVSSLSPATTLLPEQPKPPQPIMKMVSQNSRFFVGLDLAGSAQFVVGPNS